MHVFNDAYTSRHRFGLAICGSSKRPSQFAQASRGGVKCPSFTKLLEYHDNLTFYLLFFLIIFPQSLSRTSQSTRFHPRTVPATSLTPSSPPLSSPSASECAASPWTCPFPSLPRKLFPRRPTCPRTSPTSAACFSSRAPCWRLCASPPAAGPTPSSPSPRSTPLRRRPLRPMLMRDPTAALLVPSPAQPWPCKSTPSCPTPRSPALTPALTQL